MAQVEVVALEQWLAENPAVDAKALSNRLARLERGVDVDYRTPLLSDKSRADAADVLQSYIGDSG